MTKFLGACVLVLIATAPASMQPKSCPELAAEIAAQLDAKGVKAYQLDIVEAGEVGGQQVVGRCENGTKRITFKRAAKSKSESSR
jgi:Protein of unknown function (DUF1161)